MRIHRRRAVFQFAAIAMVFATLACDQPPSRPGGQSNGSRPDAPTDAASGQAGRRLTIAFRVEPTGITLNSLREAGVTDYLTKRLFNGTLGYIDNRGIAQPYLAKTLPQLHTDTWRVFDDGRMETTYALDPRATWHDGRPLTADDFLFAFEVSNWSDLGRTDAVPVSLMDDVVAPDPHTLVIRWKRLYLDAAHMSLHNAEFTALPRHIMEEAFRSGSAETFMSQPFWTREFVGLGPFRMERWEAGAFMEAAAFENDVLGKPKIDRIRIVFIGDGNTVLSNMLAGEVQMSGDGALRVEQALILRREWGPRNGGDVVMQPNQWRAVNFQMRNDLATPRSLLDVRLRRALAHATDKDAINEALYSGVERVADFVIPPLSDLGRAAEAAATKYPYDPRMTDQLMRDMGFSKDAEGFYASPTDGRFSAEIKTNAAPDNEKELAVIAAGYRAAGFDVQQAVLPVAQAQDPQVRATFPGMYVNSTPALQSTLLSLNEANIPRAENRWRGSNRGGWANAEFGRLTAQFGDTLDPAERTGQVAELARIFSSELPAISLVFRSQPWAHVAELQGLTEVPPETNIAWNVNQWTWRP